MRPRRRYGGRERGKAGGVTAALDSDSGKVPGGRELTTWRREGAATERREEGSRLRRTRWGVGAPGGLMS